MLIREDLNVPVKNGVVTSDARIVAALPTLERALQAGAAVMVVSHLGRPTEGESAATEPQHSLAPVAKRLAQLLHRDVPLVDDWIDGVAIAPGEIKLLENVRWIAGEGADDDALARRMAKLCDVFVMDAFGTAHRAQVSTHGIAKYAPVACAGPLLAAELDALGRALAKPARPMIAVVGGSKVSTKLEVLDRLAEIADTIIVGGGIANTFIAAQGHSVGKSLYEADLVDAARRIAKKVDVPLPVDVVTAPSLDAAAKATLRRVDDVRPDEMILDIGPETARALREAHRWRRNDSVERPGRRVRVRSVRRGHSRDRSRNCHKSRLFDCRRRRYACGDRQVRRRRSNFVHLDRRRRVPGVRGRKTIARGRSTRVPREALSEER